MQSKKLEFSMSKSEAHLNPSKSKLHQFYTFTSRFFSRKTFKKLLIHLMVGRKNYIS